jgi:glycine/D-amino acid oxidase-like deaminating enzyme
MPHVLPAPGTSRVLWHDDVALPDELHELRPLPRTVDVAVVGAGYCGVVAAGELARRGRATVVIDADPIGIGASTRNAGMVLPELKHGPRELARRYGPLATELVDASLDAVMLVEALIDEHAIDCDYRRTGALVLAHHDAQVAGLRKAAAEWSELLETDAPFLARGELGDEIGSDAFPGGFVLPLAGALHPARYHAGLVRVALDRGAILIGRTRALAVEPRPSGWLVRTTRGDIAAADVLVATNATVDGLVPALRRRVLPVGSYIVATEPLGPELARALIPRDRMVWDTKHLLSYWRRGPEERLLFGGRPGLGPATPERAREHLARERARVYPHLVGTSIECVWGGEVAITFDRMPHCGRFPVDGGPGVAYATGCNGTGIALATWFGATAAGWLTGEEPQPPFAQLPFPAIPLRPVREAYLPVVGWWMRARDAVGR